MFRWFVPPDYGGELKLASKKSGPNCSAPRELGGYQRWQELPSWPGLTREVRVETYYV